MTAYRDERLRILRMLEEGRITADEAAKLLDALTAQQEKAGTEAPNRNIRIQVTRNDVPEIDVSLPLQLARVAMQFIPRAVRDDPDVPDLEGLLAMIERKGHGRLFAVHKEDAGLKVELFVE